MDIYDADLTGAAFRRLCGGNQQEEDQETCVEIAPIPEQPGAFALRDSKNPAAGTLRFTHDELVGFAAGVGTL
ncbi:DUF397 domain-containing protein [Acrocarpospora catenulata]|uniref:DUF397 domain-containing protein n=1 Tax=Acrocarpospora catenulata TaxID=2836182 RepID=UPI001BDA93B3|nr:DUF397 domain-containing protein [Acrocarpospora catenulata]